MSAMTRTERHAFYRAVPPGDEPPPDDVEYQLWLDDQWDYQMDLAADWQAEQRDLEEDPA